MDPNDKLQLRFRDEAMLPPLGENNKCVGSMHENFPQAGKNWAATVSSGQAFQVTLHSVEIE